MKKNISLAIYMALVFPTLIAAQTPLEYRMSVGDTFSIRQNAKQTVVQEMEGTAHELTNDLGGTLKFTVASKTATGYRLDLVFKDFFLESTSSIQGTVMSVKASEAKEGDMMSQMFASILDHPLEVEMDNKGKIITVSGGEELIDKMIAASGIEDDFTVGIMKKGLQSDFSSQGLAQSFEQMTYFYPDGNSQKKLGETWENSYTGKLSANNTFTFEREDSESLYITGVSAVTMETEESGTTMSLSGTQEMAVQADLSTGFVQKIMVSNNTKGISKMAQLGDVEIPTTITATITYEQITE